jgi:L-histidine N-alpha-methyltransferase
VGTLTPYRLDVHLPVSGTLASLADDVRRGLSGRPRWLLPKYLYDARGCELYEEITGLPEYYQARTELGILRREAHGIVARHAPAELVELGSGSSRKTRALLDAMRAGGTLCRYLPFDISPGALLDAAGRLAESYPGLRVHGVAGDFERHLDALPRPVPGARRLVAFLGGTIGNLHPSARAPFMRAVRRLLRRDDLLLVGTDLVGDAERIRRAYDDEAGVTAEFNLNLLAVLNRELDADFDLEAFTHVAVYREEPAWVEMRLRADGPQRIRIGALDMNVELQDGEEVLTEISCKFTRPAVEAMLVDAGLGLEEWHADPGRRFAVWIARPR